MLSVVDAIWRPVPYSMYVCPFVLVMVFMKLVFDGWLKVVVTLLVKVSILKTWYVPVGTVMFWMPAKVRVMVPVVFMPRLAELIGICQLSPTLTSGRFNNPVSMSLLGASNGSTFPSAEK